MGSFSKIRTLFNTVKYLKPIQIMYQLKGKIPNKDSFAGYDSKCSLNKINLYIPELDFSPEYLKRFDAYEMLGGKVTILHHTFVLGKWNDESASHLENFNLHYFEYAIALAVAYKKTGDKRYYDLICELISSWEKEQNSPDAKHPYTTSLRIINLLIVGTALEDESIIKKVYSQYRYLINHQEKNLLGNHYFENLKTIVIGSIVFNENDIYKKYIKKLLKELDVQILGDGVHYELSPMYHKIVLEGIIRIAFVLKQAKRDEYYLFIPKIEKMLTAAYSLENGMGRTPLFNDSGDNVAKSVLELTAAVDELFNIKPNIKNEFTESGYYKLYDGDIALMFDAGAIGPDFMAGHGQCDCLSFELSVCNKPLFVNSGTYQYQGKSRSYFRSTAAHNTLIIGDTEQSECWGEHRVARRIHGIKSNAQNNIIDAEYINFLGDIHSRRLELENKVLTVTDTVKTKNDKCVRSFLHIADGLELQIKENTVVVTRGDTVLCSILADTSNVIIHSDNELSVYSPEFGKLLKTQCLEFRWNSNIKKYSYKINFN